MRVTSIKIKRIESNGLTRASADIVLDEAICVKDIKIIDGKKGLFISFPYKKRIFDGKIVDVVHPLNTEFRQKIQKAIIEEYMATEG